MQARLPHAYTEPDNFPVYRFAVVGHGAVIECGFCKKHIHRTANFTVLGNLFLHINGTACGRGFATAYLLQLGCKGPLWRPSFVKDSPKISLVKEVRNEYPPSAETKTASEALHLFLGGHPENLQVVSEWVDVDDSSADTAVSTLARAEQAQTKKRKREVSGHVLCPVCFRVLQLTLELTLQRSAGYLVKVW